MYLLLIILLMGALPIASIFADSTILHSSGDVISLIGKWFVFWSVGVRLLLAGIRQIVNPAFTASTIFDVKEPAAFAIVRELGFANVSIGLLGLLVILRPDWIVPAAVVGGLFYGLAGVLHLIKGGRNATETVAMISDLFLFVVLAGDLIARFV